MILSQFFFDIHIENIKDFKHKQIKTLEVEFWYIINYVICDLFTLY